MLPLFKYITMLLLVGLFSTIAKSHEGRPVFVEITEEAENVYQLRWKIPPVLVTADIPIISLSGAECTRIAGTAERTLTGSMLVQCEPSTQPKNLLLEYTNFNPVLSTLVLLRPLDGGEYSIIAPPDQFIIPLPEEPSFIEVAQRYAYAGFDHILEGYDHLLFVFCLILLVGSFRRILITVTGFTIGHSITLGLTAFYDWSLPPSFVEPLIAFSILMLAVERKKGRDNTIGVRYPGAVASAFGLLHGFGFGGALAEIGLPYTQKLQALAFFNLGVEAGQLLFVLMVFGLAAILSNMQKLGAVKFLSVEAVASVAIIPAGIIAGYWTLERVIGIWG
jgi:hypothetical protein